MAGLRFRLILWVLLKPARTLFVVCASRVAIDGEKRAHAFCLKDSSPFAFAGIWDRWKDRKTGEVLESFAIVTAEPNEWMAKYHDRMGVILRPKDYQRWLKEGEEHSLPIDLLRLYPEEDMKSRRVSDKLGIHTWMIVDSFTMRFFGGCLQVIWSQG
jgi:SOS response associated peptidase (SRAP)